MRALDLNAPATRTAVALLAVLGFVLAAAVGALATLVPDREGARLGIGEVLDLAKQGRITHATIRDEDAVLVGQARPVRAGLLRQGGAFSTTLPSDGALTLTLTAALSGTGAQVTVDDQQDKARARLLLGSLLPAVLVADLVALALLLVPVRTRSEPG